MSFAVLKEVLSSECGMVILVSVFLSFLNLCLLNSFPYPKTASLVAKSDCNSLPGSHLVKPPTCSVTISFLKHLFSWLVWPPHAPGFVIPHWTFFLGLLYSSSFTWPLHFRGSWGLVFSYSSVLILDDFICSRSLSFVSTLGLFCAWVWFSWMYFPWI